MYYNLIGSVLFLIASIYTLPYQNPLCVTIGCYYDYSVIYLFGCILFLSSSSIDLYINGYSKSRVLNQLGSVFFVLGSTLFLFDLKIEGSIIFRMGSCFYIISSVFCENTPLEIKVQLMAGSTLFIIGSLLTYSLYKSILWIIGSIYFISGSYNLIK